MSQPDQNFGESGLGPCITVGDVISRQVLRGEQGGRSGVAVILVLPGFKNEQAVGRWGRKVGVRGGESPKWAWLIENVGGWPAEMQEDVLRSLSHAMRRTVEVGPAGSGPGVTSHDAMPEALAGLHQATKLVEMTHKYQADGHWTPQEVSDYQSGWDKLFGLGRAAIVKVRHAVDRRGGGKGH